MSKEPALSDIVNILTSASTINANNDAIQLSFRNTLSLDGSTPNQMGADLDMNSNDILNAASIQTESLRLAGQDVVSVVSVPDWEGVWTTSTSYAINDLTRESGSVYICTEAHTSGTFATDLSNGKWELFASQGTPGPGSGDLLSSNNLSDLDSADVALANLGGDGSAISLFKGLTGSKSNPVGTNPTVPDGAYSYLSDSYQHHMFLSNLWGYQEADTDGNYSGSFTAGKIPGGQTRLARTLVAQQYNQGNHTGFGDAYNLFLTQSANRHSGFADITYWSGANSTGMIGGQVNAATDDVTLYGFGDVVLNDQGNEDVAMLGNVSILYYDGTESGSYELPRFNYLAFSSGANDVDFAYGASGAYNIGIDLSQGVYGSDFAITMAEGQRLGFDAGASVDGKFGTGSGGAYWIEKAAGNYLAFVANNQPSMQLYADSLRFVPSTQNAATMRVYGTSASTFMGLGQTGSISYVGSWSTATDDTQLVFQTASAGVEAESFRIKASGVLNLARTPTYADNAAALAGGLVAGDVYATAAGDLKIVV